LVLAYEPVIEDAGDAPRAGRSREEIEEFAIVGAGSRSGPPLSTDDSGGAGVSTKGSSWSSSAKPTRNGCRWATAS
jgi:hypothetical protein